MIARFFGIRPGEGTAAFRLGAHAFLYNAAILIYYPCAEGLFIERFGAKSLPYGFFGEAFFCVVASLIYERLQRRAGPGRLSAGIALGLAALLALLLGLSLIVPVVGLFLLFLLVPAFELLLRSENAEFLTQTFDSRTARRMLPLRGTMAAVGAILGSLLVSLLAGTIGPLHSLWLAGACLALSLVPLRGPRSKKSADLGPRPTPWGKVVRYPFAALLLSLVFLSLLIGMGVWYQVGAYLDATYESSQEMAAFLAKLYVALSAATFLFNLLVSKTLFARLGVGTALLLYPAAMVVVSLAGGAAPGLTLVASVFLVEHLFRFEILQPLSFVAVMPLPESVRPRASLAVRGALEPPAVTLACGLLLVVGPLLPWQAYFYPFAALALLALLIAFLVRRAYSRELAAALDARRFRLEDSADLPPILGAGMREAFHGQLRSSSVERNVLALHLLRGSWNAETLEAAKGRWPRWSPWVRAEAIRSMAQDAIPEAIRFLEGLPANESPEVLAERLRVGDVPISGPALEAALASEHPQVRAAAMIRLLETDGLPRIRSRLEQWAGSDRPDDHAAAATVIGRTEDASLWEALPSLHGSAPVEVLQAIARRPDPQFAPLCVALLHDDRAFPHAREILLGMGEVAAPLLLRASREPTLSARAVRLLGDLSDSVSHEALFALLEDADPEVRFWTVSALRRRGIRTAEQRTRATEALEAEVKTARSLKGALAGETGTVRAEIEAEFESALERIFLLLELLQPGRPFRRTYLSLISSDPDQRSFATEWLEATLDSRARAELLPLLEGGEAGSGETAPWIESIREVLRDPAANPELARAVRWKECPLFRAWRVPDLLLLAQGVRGGSERETASGILLRDNRPVRPAETILGKRGLASEEGEVIPLSEIDRCIVQRPRCGPAWLKGLASSLFPESGTQGDLARSQPSAASRHQDQDGGTTKGFDLWKRIFFLRSVALFAELSPAQLRLIAEIAGSVSLSAGEVAVYENQPGFHYYLVCSGSADVRRGEKQVAVLREGDAFGELALLGGRSRNATVRAGDPCELLTIGRVEFLDLLHAHPTIATALTPLIAARALDLSWAVPRRALPTD